MNRHIRNQHITNMDAVASTHITPQQAIILVVLAKAPQTEQALVQTVPLRPYTHPDTVLAHLQSRRLIAKQPEENPLGPYAPAPPCHWYLTTAGIQHLEEFIRRVRHISRKPYANQ